MANLTTPPLGISAAVTNKSEDPEALAATDKFALFMPKVIPKCVYPAFVIPRNSPSPLPEKRFVTLGLKGKPVILITPEAVV